MKPLTDKAADKNLIDGTKTWSRNKERISKMEFNAAPLAFFPKQSEQTYIPVKCLPVKNSSDAIEEKHHPCRGKSYPVVASRSARRAGGARGAIEHTRM